MARYKKGKSRVYRKTTTRRRARRTRKKNMIGGAFAAPKSAKKRLAPAAAPSSSNKIKISWEEVYNMCRVYMGYTPMPANYAEAMGWCTGMGLIGGQMNPIMEPRPDASAASAAPPDLASRPTRDVVLPAYFAPTLQEYAENMTGVYKDGVCIEEELAKGEDQRETKRVVKSNVSSEHSMAQNIMKDWLVGPVTARLTEVMTEILTNGTLSEKKLIYMLAMVHDGNFQESLADGNFDKNAEDFLISEKWVVWMLSLRGLPEPDSFKNEANGRLIYPNALEIAEFCNDRSAVDGRWVLIANDGQPVTDAEAKLEIYLHPINAVPVYYGKPFVGFGSIDKLCVGITKWFIAEFPNSILWKKAADHLKKKKILKVNVMTKTILSDDSEPFNSSAKMEAHRERILNISGTGSHTADALQAIAIADVLHITPLGAKHVKHRKQNYKAYMQAIEPFVAAAKMSNDATRTIFLNNGVRHAIGDNFYILKISLFTYLDTYHRWSPDGRPPIYLVQAHNDNEVATIKDYFDKQWSIDGDDLADFFEEMMTTASKLHAFKRTHEMLQNQQKLADLANQFIKSSELKSFMDTYRTAQGRPTLGQDGSPALQPLIQSRDWLHHHLSLRNENVKPAGLKQAAQRDQAASHEMYETLKNLVGKRAAERRLDENQGTLDDSGVYVPANLQTLYSPTQTFDGDDADAQLSPGSGSGSGSGGESDSPYDNDPSESDSSMSLLREILEAVDDGLRLHFCAHEKLSDKAESDIEDVLDLMRAAAKKAAGGIGAGGEEVVPVKPGLGGYAQATRAAPSDSTRSHTGQSGAFREAFPAGYKNPIKADEVSATLVTALTPIVMSWTTDVKKGDTVNIKIPGDDGEPYTFIVYQDVAAGEQYNLPSKDRIYIYNYMRENNLHWNDEAGSVSAQLIPQKNDPTLIKLLLQPRTIGGNTKPGDSARGRAQGAAGGLPAAMEAPAHQEHGAAATALTLCTGSGYLLKGQRDAQAAGGDDAGAGAARFFKIVRRGDFRETALDGEGVTIEEQLATQTLLRKDPTMWTTGQLTWMRRRLATSSPRFMTTKVSRRNQGGMFQALGGLQDAAGQFCTDPSAASGSGAGGKKRKSKRKTSKNKRKTKRRKTKSKRKKRKSRKKKRKTKKKI
jgi:hypothetical protein